MSLHNRIAKLEAIVNQSAGASSSRVVRIVVSDRAELERLAELFPDCDPHAGCISGLPDGLIPDAAESIDASELIRLAGERN